MQNKVLDIFKSKITSGLAGSIARDDLKEHSLKLIETSIDLTLNMLLDLHEEFQVSFHHSSEEEGVLIITGPDIPFLVDSVVNALKQRDCTINLVAYCSFAVSRDEKGALIGLDEKEGITGKEIVLQYYVSKYYGQSFYEELQESVLRILKCIHLAVIDWKGMRTEIDNLAQDISVSTKMIENSDEVADLLRWIGANNFIFLGSFETNIANATIEEPKGIFKSDLYKSSIDANDDICVDKEFMSIRKWDSPSVVHRISYMDWIEIKRCDENGACIGSINFIGLFTSSVYYQSIKNIPLLSRKIANVVARYGYPEASHNCKELITAMESLPRDELLQMTEGEIYTMATGMVSLALAPKVKIFVRKHQVGKFVSCVVFVPQNRFNSSVNDRIEALLCERFNGVISKQHRQINESQLVCIYLLLRIKTGGVQAPNVKRIEKEIANVVSIWEDELLAYLSLKNDKDVARKLHAKFKHAFNAEYAYDFSAKRAVHDIKFIEESLATNSVKFCCYSSPRTEDNRALQLKIYSPNHELPLSSTLPKIENLGLYADDMMLHRAKIKNGDVEDVVYIYCFNLKPDVPSLEVDLKTMERIEQTLDKIWCNAIEDDAFNSLVLKCQLNWKQALLFRSYSSYLQQIDHTLSSAQIINSLIGYSEISINLVKLFELKFNPDATGDQKEMDLLKEAIEIGLKNVAFAWQEKVFSIIYRVINATKRVNFYQQDDLHEYISFKIRSKEVDEIPAPKPYAEIFVYAKRFCGIHLRGGKVARGGLRWSDRREDFRTEVLGLMKAQMSKNAVIVPVGSKGGFVLKEVTMESGAEQFMQEGIACYKQFLSGLLDITDNVINGKVVPPERVVRYDGDDPYLVVAADKGTATFSDIANGVAHSYNFWLGDAFASGGSAGYDHKKMAITARGAWICVSHLFTEMGRDIANTEFRAVGIGDMAGDVFGNGMLLSNKMKLVAAFNHKHIFLDPNPEPGASFAQRKRLFDMPRSQWSDYDPAVISKGGGVFNRADKYINISEEVKLALDIKDDVLSPEALISAILKAPVELLWNGGIGTYVKAANESHLEVGDKANDVLRINGCELRCKVFGEGGNLGMTQLGRIEYASVGGRVSADFIDNSAGVDCSDHEVNIKIVLNRLMKNNELSMQERNELLSSMTGEVEQLVLQDNMQQANLLSLEEYLGAIRLQDHTWMIKYLSEKGVLDTKVEFLPTIEALSLMVADGKKLKRPEIAILMAYAKNSMFAELGGVNFRDNHNFAEILLSYFPAIMQSKYRQALLSHELHNEIVATVVTNAFVNTLGCTFFHQMVAINNEAPLRIVQAFLLVKELFAVNLLQNHAEQLAKSLAITRSELLVKVQGCMERCVEWLLRHHDDLSSINAIVDLYKPHIEPVAVLLLGENSITSLGKEVKLFTLLQHSMQILDVVHIKNGSAHELNKVAMTYIAIAEKMHLNWMKLKILQQNECEYMDAVALKIISVDLERAHNQLCLQQLNSEAEDVQFLQENLIAYNKIIDSLKVYEGNQLVAMLTIALSHIRGFYSSINKHFNVGLVIAGAVKTK